MGQPAADRPASVERLGVEHVPEEERHGRTRRVFTIWFAANLTVADYVVGVLCPLVFGLNLSTAIPVLLLGNVLGGALLGLTAAMGPRLGFPQMFSSRASFGIRGNYILGALNWLSTAGWFAINTIIAAEAVAVLAPSANFYLVVALLVVAQASIAVFGHDLIQLFEGVMSVVLGVLFAFIFVLTLPHLGAAFAFVPPGSTGVISLGAVGAGLASSFSYLMSWSPYASDYSRYLPSHTSESRVAVYALVGGAAASFAVEVLGAAVGSLTVSTNYLGALSTFAGFYGPLAMATFILGAVAANSLNIYSNSLSLLVLDIKAKRWETVVVGAAVGLAIATVAGANFSTFFENFLLALDYWITPWLAIVLVDYYVGARVTVGDILGAPLWNHRSLAIYGLAILVSVPFMVPATTLPPPVGVLSGVFGGADFSYFISFGVAGALTYLDARSTKSFSESNV